VFLSGDGSGQNQRGSQDLEKSETSIYCWLRGNIWRCVCLKSQSSFILDLKYCITFFSPKKQICQNNGERVVSKKWGTIKQTIWKPKICREILKYTVHWWMYYQSHYIILWLILSLFRSRNWTCLYCDGVLWRRWPFKTHGQTERWTFFWRKTGEFLFYSILKTTLT